MHEKLTEALNEISDKHIAEAMAARRSRRPYRLAALAAVVALVVLIAAVIGPMSFNVAAISEAQYPQAIGSLSRSQLQADTSGLASFFTASTVQLLHGTDKNRVYSPVNIYMALAMLAEVTNGTSRRQILQLLGADDLNDLQTQANTIWQIVHQDDGYNVRLLANSLWLDESVNYDRSVLDSLAENYYVSSFQGDLGSDAVNKALQNWLNDQTGNLLKKYTQEERLSAESVLALASTVYFRAKWGSQFSEQKNTDGTFHGTNGDTECTFMNKQEFKTNYFRGDNFGAISLYLEGGSNMWLILPDEDASVDSVLENNQLTELLCSGYEYENSSYLRANLSLPKFDIGSQMNLTTDLQAMGVTDAFDSDASDFSAALPGSSGVTLGSVTHATRVCIDEEGVTAAAYTIEAVAGEALPPDEIIDFILDRPFLFVITAHDNIPLFAGVVNEP